MSNYGTLDEIKRKIRRNVSQTEVRKSRNALWQFFRAVYEIAGNEKRYVPYVYHGTLL
jgi:hypothetical protein